MNLFYGKALKGKEVFLHPLIGIVLFSCNPKKKIVEDSTWSEHLSGQIELVELHLTSTQSYCGGAEPDESVLNDLGTPKSYKGRTVYIRKGNWNDLNKPILASGKSDANGNIMFQLEQGQYCMVFDDKKDDSIYKSILTNLAKGDAMHEPVDTACLAEWIKKPEFVFVVDVERKSFTYNVHINCPWYNVPCTQYTGPMPP